MGEESDLSTKKRISSFLLLIGGSIVSALLIALGMIYYYGPSGLYEAKKITLSPDFFSQLKFYDTSPKTGGPSAFVFDALQFSYYDQETHSWKNVVVSHDQYQKFYDLISEDVSLGDVTPEIVKQFSTSYYVSLSMSVRIDTNLDKEASTKTIQEVNFVDKGEYYRIELRSEHSNQNWVYFYHPSIYTKVMKIFTGEDVSSETPSK